MLAKINRIKKLGLVFADFSWSPGTPAFRPVNLVYGWNGCGKTTLTRLFDEISAPSDDDVQYELENADGRKFGPGDDFPIPVRVFNQDYIRKNVRVLESNANTISILLGEQNKDLIAQIEADERELHGDPADPGKPGKVKEFDKYTLEKQGYEKENETAFTDIAKNIGTAIVGSGAASRTYRSPDAKKGFETISTPTILEDAEITAHTVALKQEMLPELDPVAMDPMEVDGATESPIDAAAKWLVDAKNLCSATIETEMISRFNDNSDISEWVEQGVRIHAKHKSTNCEYCGNVVPQERLAQLARHFNEADQKLKARLDIVLARLREVYAAISRLNPHDPARLYREQQESYCRAVVDLTEAKDRLTSQITDLGNALQGKKARTGENISLELAFDTDALVQSLTNVNVAIETHNAKSRDFESVQKRAVRDIKIHYLSTIFEDVTSRKELISGLISDLKKREAEISDIEERIAAARTAISSTHKACEQINSGLKTFLGHEELRFEPETNLMDNDTGGQTESVIGYRIMRGDKPAAYLSEGEKTAIAFVYFVVHLNDGQFSKPDGIVVIDDPISSLDSNSLYQAFSFLKNAVMECRQVFVLTHNFEFLKLLLNWRGGGRKKKTGFYMIRNHFVGDERRASLDEMERELREYESEYHYLFKRLKEMREEQDGTIMRAYPVPNIARKVWESFLMFCVPSGDPPYTKMQRLKDDGFNAQKLDAIYKFTNDQSHITGAGFDPALVPETKKVMDELFEMMEAIAPKHFEILDRATNPA